MQTVMSSIATYSQSPRVSGQNPTEINRKQEPRKVELVFTHPQPPPFCLKVRINHSLEAIFNAENLCGTTESV